MGGSGEIIREFNFRMRGSRRPIQNESVEAPMKSKVDFMSLVNLFMKSLIRLKCLELGSSLL